MKVDISNSLINEISSVITMAYTNEKKILENYDMRESEIDHISLNSTGFVIDIRGCSFRKYLSFQGFEDLTK